MIFFRTRQLESEADLADLVHQTAMYHEDRLGGAQFARVVLSGIARGRRRRRAFRRSLEERIGAKVEPLDFRSTAPMRDRIGAAPDLLDTLAPAVGVVLRERARGAAHESFDASLLQRAGGARAAAVVAAS